MAEHDIEFFWDPVCPFAWLTSKWIDQVVDQTGMKVDWRFISLKLLNSELDYAKDFPPDYEKGHDAGLRMLRVAAAVRAELGTEPMRPLYKALSSSFFDAEPDPNYRSTLGTPEMISAGLEAAGLSTDFAPAADDESFDRELEEEKELALSRTGREVGTPIITYRPPDGISFFGPVISRVPDPEDAVVLWDAVTTLASYPGFAELKRSLRERPQLRLFGEITENPDFEDWKAGARADARP